MRITAIVFGGALLTLLAACADGNRDVGEARFGTEPDTTTFEGFCVAVARAACSDAVVNGCAAKDKEACMRAREARCLRDVPQGTDYFGENARACVQAIAEIQADGVLTADETRVVAKACGARVFTGAGSVRAPCLRDFDCRSADGLSCIVRLGEQAGQCLVAISSPIGSPCVDEAAVCEDGTYCDVKTGTCRPHILERQACDASIVDACLPGLRCDVALMGSNRCERKSEDGHPCRGDADCASSLCQKARGQAEGTCVDAIRFMSLAVVCHDHGGAL